jgi:hypothetical protein
MKVLVLLLAIPLVLAGCADAVQATRPPETIDEGKFTAETWISGLAYIDNAFVGCNKLTDGLKLHNGDPEHQTTQKTAIGTDPGETVVDVPLRAPLADNSVASVLELTSDNPTDKLKATGYSIESQTIKIEGFAPAASRTMVLTYKAWNRFLIEYVVVKDVMRGYNLPPEAAKDWVSFAPSVILGPGGATNIPIRFAIPNEYKGKIPLRWEFGIRASDMNQGMVNKGVLCTFLVTMR